MQKRKKSNILGGEAIDSKKFASLSRSAKNDLWSFATGQSPWSQLTVGQFEQEREIPSCARRRISFKSSAKG